VSDPKRMLDESGDELERALLKSVRHDAMPDGSRRRILAGLGIAGAVVTTTSSAASGLAAGKMGLFKGTSAVVAKWLAISALVGAVPTGVWVVRSHRRAQEITVPAAKASVPVESKVATKEPASEPAPVVSPETTPPPARATREVKAAPIPAPASTTLSDEVAALQVARTALAAHDAGAALGALDRYKSRYPQGRLAPEATVLRIEALIERGDRAQASALAERFEASNPKSPYLERIRSTLSRSKGQARDPGAR
jgi:TolA-binding protein